MNNSSSRFVPNQVGVAFSIAVIFILMIASIIGNILTITVILKYRKLRRDVFMQMICSLCFSDLFSSSMAWLFVHRRIWGYRDFSPVPDFLCKVFWAVETMTNYSTALHIFFFALLRMIAIRHHQLFSKINISKIKVLVIILWSSSVLLGGIPFSIWFGVVRAGRIPGWPSCTLDVQYLKAFTSYQYFGTICFFYLPGVGIIISSLIIIFTIKRQLRSTVASLNRKISKTQRAKEKQAAIQLSLIALSFFIGYVPTSAYSEWSTNNFPLKAELVGISFWFSIAAYICLRLSEFLNPIFYNVGSAKMRRCTVELLKQLRCGCINNNSSNIILENSSTPVPGNNQQGPLPIVHST